MLPSSRLTWLFALPLLLSLGLLADRALAGPLVALDAVIVFVALVDAGFNLKPLVVVTRDAPDVLSVGRANPVRFEVRSRSSRRLRVVVTSDLFEGAECEGLPHTVEIEPRGKAEITVSLKPTRRGAYELGDSFVRYPSPAGLWWRQQRTATQHAVRVYPDLQQVRAYELLARQNREMLLVRATRLKGGESEFSRLRDYTRDDEYRSIDWKATARRQRLTAREYQLESNQQLMLMLDSGRMMTAEVAGLTQFDHALNAALMLAHVASRNGDQVGLMGFDSQVQSYVRPKAGGDAGARLIQASYHLHPRLVESDYEHAFSQLALRQRQRALVVLFTQVLDDTVARTLVRQTRVVMDRHLPLIVLFRDTDLDHLLAGRPGDEQDLYVRGAAAEMLRWRSGIMLDLKRAGALVLDVAPRELTARLVNSYLSIKARHLL